MVQESRRLRWAYIASVSMAMLPISISGLLYLLGGEDTRPLRWALTGLSAIGLVSLLAVRRAVTKSEQEPTP
jgi:hypothetical protein